MTMRINRSTVLLLAFVATVLILTILVYVPGLPGPLLLDDLPQLESLIAQSAHDPDLLFRNYIISSSGPLGRPVAMATFIGNAITHGPDIWWWKFTNVMLHLASGLLVCGLTAMLLQVSSKRFAADPWIVGIIIAGFWLLHPLQVSTVLYTVQRMTELSTLFVLAGLVCYVRGRLVQEQSPGIGWLYIGLGFGLFYPLAVLSKESGLLFPVYCSLIELFVCQFRGGALLRRRLKIFHGVLLAGYLSAAAYVLVNFSSVVLESYAIRDFSLLERVLTQFRVLVVYLSQLLLPVQGKMGFFHDDISVSTGLFSPVTTLFSGLVVVALISSAVLLRKKLPLYAFGVLFFFASHALESSVLGLELMYEHRNYIGSFGILIAVLAIIPLVITQRRSLIIAVLIGLTGFSFLTWQRTLTWSSPGTLYEHMYESHPESPRLNLFFTNVHASAGDFVRARQTLAKVGAGLGKELHGLFLDCLEHQKVEQSALSGVEQLSDGIVNAHTTSSARSLVQQAISGQCDASRRSLVAVLDHLLSSRMRSDIDKRSVLFTKAGLLESMGRIDAAVEEYVVAQKSLSDDAMPLYLAARTLISNDRPDEARIMLTSASELEKNTRIQRRDMAQSNYLSLGQSYAAQDQFETALSVYAEATVAMPRQSLFYAESAKLLLQLGRYDEVRELLTDIRTLELADIDQFERAFSRIETALEQLSN